MLNKIILMGRLTREPELRTTQSGVSVTTFTLAVERDFQRGEEKQTDFIDIVAWRGTADFVHRNFRKGQLVAVTGRLQSRKWEDREGNKRVSFEVVAEEVHFAERKQQDGPPPYGAPYQPAPQQPPSYGSQTQSSYGSQSSYSSQQAYGSGPDYNSSGSRDAAPAPAPAAPPPTADAPPFRLDMPSTFAALDDDDGELPF